MANAALACRLTVDDDVASHEGARVSGDGIEVVTSFYRALAAADADGLLELLDPAFRGEVTAGLPEGWGGAYEGPRQMLEQCWSRVFAQMHVKPIPEEYLLASNSRLVVLGRYVGTVRTSGAPFEAAFAHVLRIGRGRITELIQLTDSWLWHEALKPTSSGNSSATRGTNR